jgi:hypothetical protein
MQEPEAERPEHQDDADAGRQPLPEVASEEQDVHPDHDTDHQDDLMRLAACVLVAGFVVAGTGCGASDTGSAPRHSSSVPTNSPTSSPSAAVHAVVQAYWHDIAAGDFRAAFLKFDGSEQTRTHGQHWFVADKVRDAPIKVRLRLGTAAVNGAVATVPIVLLQTVGSLTGCHRWAGSYRLRDIGSRWLIDATNLTKHGC